MKIEKALDNGSSIHNITAYLYNPLNGVDADENLHMVL